MLIMCKGCKVSRKKHLLKKAPTKIRFLIISMYHNIAIVSIDSEQIK